MTIPELLAVCETIEGTYTDSAYDAYADTAARYFPAALRCLAEIRVTYESDPRIREFKDRFEAGQYDQG